MSTPITGSFVSTGAAVNIPLPAGTSRFTTYNQTQMIATQTTAVGVEFTYLNNPSFPVGGAIEKFKSDVTHATGETIVSTGGFTYLTAPPAPAAAVVGTAITAATPAVVTMTNTYTEGDRVILYNTTGMAQIGGMAFTISSVSGSGFSLLGLPAAGFAAAATAATARKVSPYNAMLPEFMYVTAISKASQAVITVSADPTNVIYVGQKLVFQIPSSFGMVEMNSENLNGIPAIVTAVSYSTYQFTVNVNSSAFTTFAFPASSTSPTSPLFATVAPQGSSTQYNPSLQTYTGYNFDKQPFRSSQEFPLINLQAGINGPAGQSGDIIVWVSETAPVAQYASNA